MNVATDAVSSTEKPAAGHQPGASNDRGIATLKRMIETHCGLNLATQHDHFLTSRVARRMAAVGVQQLDEYLFYLFERGNDELHQLINLLTINETYFFRHREQFDLLLDFVRRRQAERPSQPVTIWCAACSIGAEPYSVAIALRDAVERQGLRLKLLATDIDETALTMARAGRYSRRAVTAEMPGEHLKRWFTPRPDGDFQLSPEIIRMVHFRRHNLKSDLYPTAVDIVFCRNVLIYFNEANKWDVVRRLHDALLPDGRLFLSPVESAAELRVYFDEETGPNGLRCYRKWSTDLRKDRPAPAARVLDLRRPLESYPFPIVTRRQDRITVAGIIDGEERAQMLGNDLLFALGRFSDDEKGRFTLDLTEVPFICNHGLEILTARLRLGVKNGCRVRLIMVRDERLRSSLVAAGFAAIAPIQVGAEALPVAPSAEPPRRDAAPPLPSSTAPVPAHPSAIGDILPRFEAPFRGSPPRTLAPARPPAARDRPAATKKAAPAGPESVPVSGPASLVVDGIHSAAEAARWINRLYELKRRAEAAGTSTVLTIDMRGADFVEQSFFAAFRQFLEQSADRWKITVLCPSYLKLWFLKYQIPETLIKGVD